MKAERNLFPVVMKSTAIATAAATVALAALHHIFPQDWILSAAISTGTTCYHFAMRLLVGAIVPRFTIDPNAPWFRRRGFEPKLYAALQVKKWKANMPTYDPDSFSLKHHTLHQIVYNSCNAEVVHEVIFLFSFLPLFAAIPCGAFPVFLITSLLAALYDSIFVIMQRYNRPRLIHLLEKRKSKCTTVS